MCLIEHVSDNVTVLDGREGKKFLPERRTLDFLLEECLSSLGGLCVLTIIA